MNNPTPAVPAVFQFESRDIRAILVNGESWFIAIDVAKVLGYTNPHKAISDHCRGVNKTLLPSTSGLQNYLIIPERDVYRLIMRSKLPSAERFEEWVVGEVLPAIRKTGSYQPEQAQTVTIPPARYIELLEIENRMLRGQAETPRIQTKAKAKHLDDTGVNRQLYARYVQLHTDTPLSQWWRDSRIPLSFETVAAALLRNQRKSAATIGALARALQFPTHDIRMMLLKMKGGESAVLLT